MSRKVLHRPGGTDSEEQQASAVVRHSHRKAVCPVPQSRRAPQLNTNSSIQGMYHVGGSACCLSDVTAAGPQPPVIHSQLPRCHQHSTPGGYRSISGWWPELREGPDVGSDLITSQLIRGTAWAVVSQYSPALLPASNKSER